VFLLLLLGLTRDGDEKHAIFELCDNLVEDAVVGEGERTTELAVGASRAILTWKRNGNKAATKTKMHNDQRSKVGLTKKKYVEQHQQ